jgi:hypothetical protein
MRAGIRPSTIRGMRERERFQVPLPRQGVDRVLLGLGAAALIAVVPILWIWLAYGSALTGPRLWVAGIGLCALTAGIGAAMIRLLDGPR